MYTGHMGGFNEGISLKPASLGVFPWHERPYVQSIELMRTQQ